jgi:hypothetical protein
MIADAIPVPDFPNFCLSEKSAFHFCRSRKFQPQYRITVSAVVLHSFDRGVIDCKKKGTWPRFSSGGRGEVSAISRVCS